jgi:hypothetical protein
VNNNLIKKEKIMKNLRGVPPKRKGGEGNISGDTIREPFAYFEVPMEEDVVVKIFAGCPPTGGDAV